MLDMFISYGGFPELAKEEKVYNTHIIVNPMGEIISIYRKLHLFDVDLSSLNGPVLLESKTTIGGKDVITCKLTNDITLGLSTWYHF